MQKRYLTVTYTDTITNVITVVPATDTTNNDLSGGYAVSSAAAASAASAAAEAYSVALDTEKTTEEAETKALEAETKALETEKKAIAEKNATLLQQQKEFNLSIAYKPPTVGSIGSYDNIYHKNNTSIKDPYSYDSPTDYNSNNGGLPITFTQTPETKKPTTGGEQENNSKRKEDKDNWKFKFEWLTPPLPELTFPNYTPTASQIIVENMIDGSADAWMAGGALYDSPRAGDVYFNETGDMNTVRFLGLNDKNYNTHLDRKLQGMANVYKILGVHAGDGDMHGENAMAKLYQSHVADVLSKIAASDEAVEAEIEAVEAAIEAVEAQKAAEDARILAGEVSVAATAAATATAAAAKAYNDDPSNGENKSILDFYADVYAIYNNSVVDDVVSGTSETLTTAAGDTGDAVGKAGTDTSSTATKAANDVGNFFSNMW